MHIIVIGCIAHFLCLSWSPEVNTFPSFKSCVFFSVSSSTEKISANIGETCVCDLIAENIHIFKRVGRL